MSNPREVITAGIRQSYADHFTGWYLSTVEGEHFADAILAALTAAGYAVVDKTPLTAIAEGYPVRGEGDRFIVVENPDFQPDNGSDPSLVIDVLAAASTDHGGEK